MPTRRHIERDLAVIGGGVIGLAIAFEAAWRGKSVIVGDKPVRGVASEAAAGMLAPVAEAEPALEPLTRLCLASRARYPAFLAKLAEAGEPISIETRGTLFPALHADHARELEVYRERLGRLDLAAEWLEPERLRSLEPNLSPRALGGLFVESDRAIDPRALRRALRAAVVRLGGVVIDDVERVRLDPTPALERRDESLEISAPSVVVAAGAWSGELLGERRALPLRPVKGQTLRLSGESLISHVIRTPEVYLVPRGGGEIVVGASSEERGFDDRVLAGVVAELLRDAQRVLPGAFELALSESSVGFRPALRDHLPAIGARDGIYVAIGHHRNGVLLAPITAELLLDQIERGARPAALAPFDPDRFGGEA
jgi:glycine oxidase